MYRKYADELVRFATGLVGPHDAEDVVSEAVLRCMSSPRWAKVEQKRAYLYRSVLNEASRLRRTVRRRRSRDQRADAPPPTDGPSVQPEVLDAVRLLSVQQRAVIVLTYWDDLNPRSIADLLGVSEGAVKRQLARARSRLKETLHDDD